MKKYLPLIILFVLIVGGRFYAIHTFKQKYEKTVATLESNIMYDCDLAIRNMEAYEKSRREHNPELYEKKYASIQKESRDVDYSQLLEEKSFYRTAQRVVDLLFIFLLYVLIEISAILYYYYHRKDEIHPKIFFVLIFNWLYLSYFICEKKKV